MLRAQPGMLPRTLPQLAQILNECVDGCAESRRAQRQLLQAQSRLREAQEAVEAVEQSMQMIREGTPQNAPRRTGSRTRSGRVGSGPNLSLS